MAFSGSSPSRVVVLDDHTAVRHRPGHWPGRECALPLTGSYAISRGAFEARSSVSIGVAVIEFPLGPSDIDGLNLTRTLEVRFPRSRILIISAQHNAAAVALVLYAGPGGSVSKRQGPNEPIAAIHTVADGRSYIEPEVMAEITVLPNQTPDRADADTMTEQARSPPRERKAPRRCRDSLSVSRTAAKFPLNINISTRKQPAFSKLRIRTDNELLDIRHQIEKT